MLYSLENTENICFKKMAIILCISYFIIVKNIYMLDLKSKLVLKILIKECPYGSYNIIESKDIISAMPSKYKIDMEGLENILIYLERQEYISIKYDDDGVYCLCVLPFGNEILENDDNKKREGNPPRLWVIILLVFISSLLACLLGTVLGRILPL